MNFDNRIVIKILKILIAIISIGGIYFTLAVPAYYLSKYYLEKINPLRHEYLQGVVLSFIIGFWFWLTVAILLIIIRLIVYKTKAEVVKN